MKLIHLESAETRDSFDVIIGIQVPFFRVSVTIEPGHSLLQQFVTTNCFIFFPRSDYIDPSTLECLERAHSNGIKSSGAVFK